MWFKDFLKRHHEVSIRKSESLSVGRWMGMNDVPTSEAQTTSASAVLKVRRKLMPAPIGARAMRAVRLVKCPYLNGSYSLLADKHINIVNAKQTKKVQGGLITA